MYNFLKFAILAIMAACVIFIMIYRIRGRNVKTALFGVMASAFACSMVLFFYLIFFDAPVFEIRGEHEVNIEVFGEFADPGFTATHNNRDLSDQVTVSGEVDCTRPGTYTVKYNLRTLYYNITEKRTVHITDSLPPVIEFLFDESKAVYSADEIDAYNFKASDNVDGDVTDKVKVSRHDNNDVVIFSYSVTDSSGNTADETKSFRISPLGSPKITLNGPASVMLVPGEKYTELGATAEDTSGKNLTDKIKISGSVNLHRDGLYQIVYSVKDSQGNKSEAVRNVRVLSDIEILKNTVYLTFDDGPSRNVTPRILDILKENSVKATFFIVNYADADKDIVKRIVDEGHTLAIHGYSHNYNQIYKSEEAFMENVRLLEQKIFDDTGCRTKILRFPGGSSNRVSSFNPGIMTRLSTRVIDEGYVYFDWNVSSEDAVGGTSSKNAIVQSAVNGLAKGRQNVVLLHDSSAKSTTADALPDIIRYCKEQGYFFDAITDSTPPITHRVAN
ncbi:MAG: polysaccharide deacetylase family protein [Oscillospiraceae bacterium]|nr:polysaccharide deacetylase family protein [Oscillospiraceae bacterium]